MKYIFRLLPATLLFFISCKKDSDNLYNNSVKAPLSVEFDNIAGSSDLELNTGVYTNASGQSFSIQKLRYYVSNFIFTNVDGSVYTVPADSSYFLIKEGTVDEVALEIPEGEYNKVSFVLGVDSSRSTMDISHRTGVLDPAGEAADMYWDSNNGYIFYNLEGTSPAATSPAHTFSYHAGGFGGYTSATANNLKTITLDLTSRVTPKVKAGKETNIHLMVDVLKAFSAASNISLATTNSINTPAQSVLLANNFTGMFRHDHTEN